MHDIFNIRELGELDIVEIYEYCDRPLLFSCKNKVSQLYVAFFAKNTPDDETWLYVEISPARHKDIRSGKIDFHKVFAEPEMERIFKAMIPHDVNNSVNSKCVDPSELLNEISPLVDVCITDINQPLFYEADISEPEAISDRPYHIIKFGDKTHSGEVQAISLANVISCYQRTINTIRAKNQEYKKLPQLIKDSMQFYTFAFQKGSFEIYLTQKKREEEEQAEQTFLFDEILPDYDLLSQETATSELFRLLQSKDNKSDLREVLLGLGTQVTEKYKDLCISFRRLQTGITLSSVSPTTNIDSSVFLTQKEICSVVDILKVMEDERKEECVIEGELKGLWLKNNRFQIEGQNKTITGHILKNPSYKITSATINGRYEARIQEIEKKNEITGKVAKTEYILLDLEEI